MKKTAIAFGLSVLLLATTGCQEQETNEESVKQVSEEMEQATTLSENAAKKLMEDTLTSISMTLREVDQAYDWYDDIDLFDLDVIKEVLSPFATEKYIEDNYELLKYFYQSLESCETLFPNVNTEVRFLVEQNDQSLHLEGLELGNDMYPDSSSTQSFDFIYTDGTWKLNQHESTNQGDIQLTLEEATLIVQPYNDSAYTFEKEVEEGGEILYIFINDSGDRLSVNRATGYCIGYTEESTKTTESVEVTEEEMEAETVSSSQTASASPGSNATKLPTKAEYLAKLDEVSSQEVFSEDGSTFEIRMEYAQHYGLWDDALNELYGLLRENLSTEVSEDLLIKQRQWLSDFDAKVEHQARVENDGYDENGEPYPEAYLGSFYLVSCNRISAELTKERVYELVELYLK